MVLNTIDGKSCLPVISFVLVTFGTPKAKVVGLSIASAIGGK